MYKKPEKQLADGRITLILKPIGASEIMVYRIFIY